MIIRYIDIHIENSQRLEIDINKEGKTWIEKVMFQWLL